MIFSDFLYISYKVDITVVSLEDLKELEVVIELLKILIKLIRIYKPRLEPFDDRSLEITESKVNFLVILLVLLRKILEVQFTLENECYKLSGI